MERRINPTRTIKSENSFTVQLILSALAGLAFTAAGVFFIWNATSAPYPQLFELLLGVFLGGIGILTLVSLVRLDTIYLHPDRIEVESLFGKIRKVLPFDENTQWIETGQNGKHKSEKMLIVRTGSLTYRIMAGRYKNYPEMARAIKARGKEDKIRPMKWERRRRTAIGIGCLLLSVVSFQAAFRAYLHRNDQITKDEFVTLEGVVAEEVEINRGRRSRNSIHLKLQAHPLFKFSISGASYRASDAARMMGSIQQGDTVSLDIRKHDFQTRISQEKPLGFWDKTVNYALIRVYGLRDNTGTYLTWEAYQIESRKGESTRTLFAILLGFLLLGGSIYLLVASRRIRPPSQPTLPRTSTSG